MMDQLAPININSEMIAAHLELMFHGTSGYAPFRLLQEKNGSTVRNRLPFVVIDPTLAQRAVTWATQAADTGAGAFVVPGTVPNKGSAKASDVVQMACLLVDLDTGDIAGAFAQLESCLGPASMVVESGGITQEGQNRLHLYWRLIRIAAGEDLKRLCTLRGLLADKVGGDRSFASPHQPIRLAGSIYAKSGQRRLVQVIAQNDRSYDLDTIARAIEAMSRLAGLEPLDPAAPRLIQTHQNGPSASDLKLRRIRSEGRDDITRFAAIGKVIGHWLHVVRSGRIPLDLAWAYVQDHNAARIDPPWSEPKLRASFDELLNRDIVNHGPMPVFGALRLSNDNVEFAADFPDTDDDARTNAPSTLPEPVFLSDDDMASRFAERFRSQLRYVAARGCWMVWKGHLWQADETRLALNSVRLICRVAADQVNDEKMARRLCSERTINAVEKLARTDPRISEQASVWDRGTMIINTPKGVIDLTTGEIRPHEPNDLLTRIAGASPGKGCPRWLRFLKEVTGEKPGLADYLQRVAGYCLTGSMSEQVFFFLHGTGANGKSVFISTLSDVLGDYAATAALDTFTSNYGDRHPTDLAGIATARAVFVTETEHGKPWAESRIKAITGGDTLRVRFLYQNFFEVDPTFKIIVAGNARPRLVGVGEAMRRRLHLIPFDVTIPPEARETDLQSQLHNERDGIFGWMLEGCAAWLAQGLAPPACIHEAAAAYFQDEDLVGQWIEEACTTVEGARAPSSQLYRSWAAWAEARGFECGSQRSLGEELRSRGLQHYRTGRERGWIGLRPIHAPLHHTGAAP